MINLSDYEGWKAKQQQQSVAAANAVLVNAAEQNPDEVAGNLTLADEFAKTTGNPRPPAPLVAEYKNTFQALIEQKKNETILSSAPQLTEWLRNPANAVLAVDDVANLGWFEGAWQGYKNLDVRATERVKQMGNQLVLETTAQRAKDRKLTFGEILADAQIDRSGITDTSGAPVRTNDGSEYLSAIGRWVDARFADFYNLDDDAKSKEAANAIAKNLERMAAAPKSYLAQTFEKEAQVKDVTFGEAIKNYTGAALKNPVGFLTWAIETGGESAPQLAATLAAGALGGPVAAARMTFATSGLTERYTSPAEYFKEKGFDLSKPEDVQRMLADPDVLRDAAQRGVIRGIVVGAFDALSVGIAGKAMVSNPIAEFVAQGLTQAALGGGGEYFARLAAGQAIDWNDILAEAFAELATAPVESVAAGRKFIRDRQSVKDAEERATVVDQLDAQTAASKLKLRHPDTFRDFVATATEGTPTQNIFVPAQEFVTYFQGLGVDPYALADSLEGVSREDLTAAIAAGDDLQIPTATYAAKISGTEYAPFFKENAKFQPGEMSLREAADFKAREPQALDEAWQVAQETQRRDMLDNAGFEDVRAEMSARFRAAGRSAEVANTEALTFAAFYRTMAQRVGQTVDDFMRAYPLPIVQGAIPQGMQFRDVDALNRTLAEARSAKPKGDKRQGLLDFIANYGGVIDLGGELKARDAETLHQPGKKKLRLSRDATAPAEKGKGYGPDDVARAAIDAGFMADVPAVVEYKQAVLDGRETPDIVRAFWDAVDAELRGQAQPAAAAPVEEYLARLGLTLNDSDAVIKEAIRKDQAGQNYDQPALARAFGAARSFMFGQPSPTETPAFKKWFGDSKIVDPDGKPLVVYHGTPSDVGKDFAFDPSKIGEGSKDFGYYGAGFYFTNRDYVAKTYANKILPVFGATPDLGPVLPIYLSIKKPLVLNAQQQKLFKESADRLAAENIPALKFLGDDKAKSKAFSDAVKAAGYDGIVVRAYEGEFFGDIVADNLANDPEFYATTENAPYYDKRGVLIIPDELIDIPSEIVPAGEGWDVEIVAFEPTQIKSVDNVGTFNPNDARIYQQPAYHGTPHLFEKFSTGQIGTGEGAQVYGWGLYFASEKGVAQHYRNTLARAPEITIEGAEPFDLGVLDRADYRQTPLPGDMLEALRPYLKWPAAKYPWQSDKISADEYLATEKSYLGISLREALRGIRENMEMGTSLAEAIDLQENHPPKDPRDAAMRAVVLSALRGRIRVSRAAGRLFEVEVPDNNDLMNWDAPVSEQPAPVREALAALGVGEPKVVPPAILKRAQAIVKRAERINGGALGMGYTIENDQKLYREAREIEAEFDPGAARDSLGRWIVEITMPHASRVERYTARAAYEALSRRMGGDDKAASEALRAAGIPGHRYVGWESQTTNYVIYDDTRVAVRSYEQRKPLGPKGQIEIPAGGIGNGDTVIRLFETADLSTVIHESGHYFLAVMQDIAAKGEQSAATGLATINAWWRENAVAVAKDGQKVTGTAITEADVQAVLDNGTTGDLAKDAAVDVGQQEQFARAFEAYLMEGKAPSADLRSAFEKFRAWLIAVYRSLVNLNVKVTDDIRAVMDRMIATDEEIAKAKEDAGDGAPIFATAEQMGLSQDEFDGILKMRAQAEDEAKARLLQETMEPIRRERERAYKEAKAEVLAEVEKEVNSLYVYRALEWMGNRRWLGDGQPEAMADFRLSKDILVERYGEGVLKTLPRGKQTIYAVEGGVDPDLAADLFGFSSGDEMIRALERATPRQEAIKAELDKAMAERYPDPLTDGDIEAKALDAVHVDKRGMWIAAELKAVTEVAGRDGAMTMKQARVAARQTIARMKVRDAVNAGRFLAAERRAATEAANLAGMLGREGVWMNNARRRIATKARAALREDAAVDAVAGQIDQANRSTGNYNETVAALIDAKRKQLLNHALYMEARKVADEVQKGENFVGRLNKATTRERIAGAGRRDNAQIDYLAAIDEILERYDFRKMSGTAEERRGSLLDFVEAMKAAGRENELNIPESVMRQAARAPYKTLPVEQFRGVIDSLKNLEHVASRWDALIDAQNKRNLDVVVTDIVAEVDANLPNRPPSRFGTAGEQRAQNARAFLNIVLNADTMLRDIDGGKNLGPAYRSIKSPIDDAANRLVARKRDLVVRLEELYSVYSEAERDLMQVREFFPALNDSLAKWERIAIALNTGNPINLERLTNPDSPGALTETQVGAVLASLDARDAKFVQSVWDLLDSFRPEIAARERRSTGTEPTWVVPAPVTIGGIDLKGGYYPIAYDPRLSGITRDDDFHEMMKGMTTGRFGKAQTRDGHLQERARSTGRALKLDMAVFHRHLNQVAYDLEFSEPVANAWRILQDGRFRDSMVNAGRQADLASLDSWALDVGTGELRAADQFNTFMRSVKSKVTVAKLGLNIVTVLLQPTGLIQSMVGIGKKDFFLGFQEFVKFGDPRKAAQFATEQSPFMATREQTAVKEAMDFYDDPKRGFLATKWGKFQRDKLGPAQFLAMQKMQFWSVDVITWFGGYYQGLRQFEGDTALATAHADGVVKRLQGSGNFSDRSGIERGTVSSSARQMDMVKIFTLLASYQMAKANVTVQRTRETMRTFKKEGFSVKSALEGLNWAGDMVLLFAVEALIGEWLRGKWPDDEEKEKWAKFMAKTTAMSVLGVVPFVRDGANAFEGRDTGGALGAMFNDFAKPFIQAGQGEIDAPLVKSFIAAGGIIFGLPAVQINRAVDAGWRQASGEEVAPIEYLVGKRKH